MTSNEIVTALRRCTSKMPEPYCTDCSFAGKGTSAGKDDCIGAAMDAAAASIEKLVDRCARYAEEIAVLQEQRRWISAAEKLPEPGERVIVKDDAFCSEAYLTVSGTWCRYDATPWADITGSPVTHWMPLPEA